MASLDLKTKQIGRYVVLERDQWGNHSATISDYPGLLDEIIKYTWTYQEGKHPYLRCGKLKTTLHRFVLSYLYGKVQLDHMLENDNVIEHLDNNGLNCSYDNLHVISSNYNKAKAFTIDKDRSQGPKIPTFVTDVFYSHEKSYYQMQVFFNRNVYFKSNGQPIESFYFQYRDFRVLYSDWVYIYSCRQKGIIDIFSLHKDRMVCNERPSIDLKEDERDKPIVQRGEQLYMRLNPDGGEKAAFLIKASYDDIE